MKYRLFFILFIFTLILAACQPATSLSPEPDNQTTDGLNSQPGEEVLGGDGLTSEDNGTASGDFPRPEVVWSRDPVAVIVSGTFCCGFTTPLVPLNYLPDFQIWGDGRYIWVTTNAENPTRQVLQGQLTEDQLTSILEKAINAGFFGWEDRYENLMISDLADQCLTINLESVIKSVCEYASGAPEAFHSLYDSLAAGSGIAGADYIPTEGFLTSFPYPEEAAQPVQESDILSEETFFSLSEAVNGMWIEGEALVQAWNAINADPWNATVRQGDTFYNISLQIPGLSMNEPPAK